MKRRATAEWNGGLKDGKGSFTGESGAIKGSFAFVNRFGEEKGTNPEELIAAAHASCFSMALSAQLGEAGLQPQSVHTTATVTLDKDGSGWAVTESHLDVAVRVGNSDQARFEAAAKAAKENCPISKLLKAKITMDAKLE